MKHIIPYFLIFCFFASLNGQDAAIKKINLAVLELEGKNVSQAEASILTDKLRGEFVRSGRFQVIERGQMETILKEQGFQQSGCTDQSCLVEMGQLMGVERMAAGSVGKIGNMFLVSVRMIDVAKGQILATAEEERDGSIEEVLKSAIPAVVQALTDNTIGTPSSSVRLPPFASKPKGGLKPAAATCLMSDARVGLAMNEGQDVTIYDWMNFCGNVVQASGLGILIKAYTSYETGFQKAGARGFCVSYCMGPRAGSMLPEYKIRSIEKLLCIPVVNIYPTLAISMEAYSGKTLTQVIEEEKLKR